MPSNLPQFTVRVDPFLLKKFRYVAEYHARSANREAETLIRQHVEEFEKKYGPIIFDDSTSQSKS